MRFIAFGGWILGGPGVAEEVVACFEVIPRPGITSAQLIVSNHARGSPTMMQDKYNTPLILWGLSCYTFHSTRDQTGDLVPLDCNLWNSCHIYDIFTLTSHFFIGIKK